MPERTTPQQQKAVGFLQRLISRHKPGDRLPTVAQLAVSARVSHVTMWKALRRLVVAGALSAVHGGGIRVRDTRVRSEPQAPEAGPGRRLRHWEKVCARLEADILRGAYPSGRPIPSHKELSRTYGACYLTLKRALGELEGRGSIVASLRTYETAPVSSSHRGSRVALIAAGDSDGGLRLVTPWVQDQWRALEQECSRLALGLEAFVCGRLAGDPGPLGGAGRSLAEACRDPAILGFHVWTSGLDEHTVMGLVDRIRASRKVVAVLDPDEDRPSSFPSGPDPRIRVFRAADSVAAGRAVGRLLLSLGHRRIAYLSPVHGVSWSRRRLEGLTGACREAGLSGAVAPCVLEHYSYRTQFVREDERSFDEVRRVLSKGASGLGRAESVVADTLREMESEAMGVMKRVLLRRKLAPLFAQALASGATAWVGCNDETALEALVYLRGRSLRVPQDVSVAGFDDSPEAFVHKLTSCSFNTVAAIRPMLDFVLAPRTRGAGRAGTAAVVIDGHVSERGTTGRPAAEADERRT